LEDPRANPLQSTDQCAVAPASEALTRIATKAEALGYDYARSAAHVVRPAIFALIYRGLARAIA